MESDKTVIVRSQKSNVQLNTLSGHNNYGFASKLNVHNNIIASFAGFDRTIILWDIRNPLFPWTISKLRWVSYQIFEGGPVSNAKYSPKNPIHPDLFTK